SGIAHRKVSEDFAVYVDPPGFEAVHEFAVRKPIQARSGADALNPQPPELPLTIAAIAVRVAVRAIGSFLSRLVKLALGEEKPLGAAQIFLAARAAFGATFHSSHCYFSCGEIASSGVSPDSRFMR